MPLNKDKKNKIEWLPEDTSKKVRRAFETKMFLEDKYKSYFTKNAPPPFLSIEKKSYEEALKVINPYIKQQFSAPNMKDTFKYITHRFWTIEYIRRNYFINNKDNLNRIEEAILLHELREKYDDLVKKNPPNLILCGDFDNCYYKNINFQLLNENKYIKYPFFYNTRCQTGCNFKSIIMRDIVDWHHHKHKNTADSFPNNFNNKYICNYLSSWTVEYKKIIDKLHSISYEYGVFIFDLFALTSPSMLLDAGKEDVNSQKNKLRALFKEVKNIINSGDHLKNEEMPKISDSESTKERKIKHFKKIAKIKEFEIKKAKIKEKKKHFFV